MLTSHIESDWIIDSQATCKAEGSQHKECTSCKEVLETEVISKTEEHNYVGGICDVCGDVDSWGDNTFPLPPDWGKN